MWKICVEASPKSITISSISPSGRDGAAKKQSSTVASPVDPGEQEAAAGRAGQRALGDRGGKGGYDAGVDRVAALREHARAGFGGDPISGCDRSLHELRVKMLAEMPITRCRNFDDERRNVVH